MNTLNNIIQHRLRIGTERKETDREIHTKSNKERVTERVRATETARLTERERERERETKSNKESMAERK